MQGPENYPTEMYRNHYSNIAKNAAIVSMSTHYGPSTSRTSQKMDLDKDNAFYHYSDRSWDDTTLVYNYVNEMMDSIHYQGSLILFAGNSGGNGGPPGGGGAPGGGMPGGPSGGGMPGMGMGSQSVDEIVAEAKAYEKKGYDVYQIHANNAEAVKRIREETNLILLGRYSGAMRMPGGDEKASPSQATAAELEQCVEQARKLEGLIDILWIRVEEHPNSWNQDRGKPKSLAYAEAIKKAGLKIITCPSAGFHNPVENDQFIAEGKTDMVGMTTPFFADPELVRKLKEGRVDDVVPCVGCQNCHGISMNQRPWYSTCTVNPGFGLPPYQLKSITKPLVSKKVAVIGGGPSGMKAALIAAERGHAVTIFDRETSLGGLLKISDNSKWRWAYKDLKEYYIYQVKKAGITVKLNTTATLEMIMAAKFDTALVATGSALKPTEWKPDGEKIFSILDVYRAKEKLGKNVVIVGGGKYAVEAGVGMYKDGHKITILAPGKRLVEEEYEGPHNMRNQERIISSAGSDFTSVLETKVKEVSGGKVTYTDFKGQEQAIQADSIVVFAGLRPRMDEAEKFIGSADEVLFLGDCTGTNGTLQKTIRSAFFVASQV